MRSVNRWWIAVAGVCMQMALGAGYAWSVFRIPLVKEFGWSISQVSLTFTISWFFLGATAFLGGLWLNRSGPRIVAMVAGLMWGGGVFLASFAAHKLWLLYLTYGVIGGIGLGMGYIVPVTVLVKWFPERRGLITGIAVGGFGAGSLIAAPLAGRLMQSVGVMPTFMYLGIAYGVVAICAGFFMRVPPEGWKPAGWTPTAAQVSQRSDRDYTLGEALRTWQWWALCGLMSINTIAGVSVVSQAAPIFQELGKVSAVTAASFVGIISLGNGLGRVLWSWISDVTSRKTAFFAMYLIQAVLFWTFHSIASPTLLFARHFRHPGLLRRRVRDHSSLRGGLFWPSQRGTDFWVDVASVGVPRRIRSSAIRLPAAIDRRLQPGAVPDRESDDRGDDTSGSRFATARPQDRKGSGRWRRSGFSSCAWKRGLGLARIGVKQLATNSCFPARAKQRCAPGASCDPACRYSERRLDPGPAIPRTIEIWDTTKRGIACPVRPILSDHTRARRGRRPLTA